MIGFTKRNMAVFYERCQKQGCTDMRDPDQAMKAKILARELHLHYDDIAKLYEQAKAIHPEVVAADNAKREAAAAEAARRAVDGELLITLVTDETPARSFSQYLRPDGSKYYTVNEDPQKTEGSLYVTYQQYYVTTVTNTPSKTVFTSATVGGITTGGFHETGPSQSTSKRATDKGIVEMHLDNRSFPIHHVLIPSTTCQKFKMDDNFRTYGSSGRMLCMKDKRQPFGNITAGSASSGSSFFTFDSQEELLLYKECKAKAKLIENIIQCKLPPTEEDVYQKAIALSESESSYDVDRARTMFLTLKQFNYKDSAKRAGDAENRYAEVLQKEKEKRVLRYEKRRKTFKNSVSITKLLVSLILPLFMIAVTTGACFGYASGQITNIAAIIGMGVCALLTFPGISNLVYRINKSIPFRILRWALPIIVFLAFAVIVGSELPTT